MPNRDLIVVGASAGGIEALQDLLAGLPDDLAASLVVVVHMPPTGGRVLQRILARSTKLKVLAAVDGDDIRRGRIYTAIGDHHVLVGRGHLHVRKGPRENGHRPAVDPLFRSAAAYYGPRAIGVILSGALHDGTYGLFSIKSMGGLAVVQDPGDALYEGMPASAMDYVDVDYAVPAHDLGPLLARVVSEQADPGAGPPGPQMHREVEVPQGEDPGSGGGHPGKPSAWPCPDCAGVLWEIEDGPILRFRCRVGHAWVAETLLQQQGEGVEGALWMALRALEDRAALSLRLAQRAEKTGRPISAGRYREDLDAMDRNIAILRRLLAGERAGSDVAGEGSGGRGLERG